MDKPDNCSHCGKKETIFDPDLDKEPCNVLNITTKEGEFLCSDCVWDFYDWNCPACGVYFNTSPSTKGDYCSKKCEG